MTKLFKYLSYLQFLFFGMAFYFYFRPLWSEESPLDSVNTGLLFTGIALSFVSLMEVKKPLGPAKAKLFLVLLLPVVLVMFTLSTYWLLQDMQSAQAQSLLVLAIGMLSLLKMILSIPAESLK